MDKINLDSLSHFLLNPDLKETDHIKNIKDISYNFTQDRSKISDYTKDRNYVSSYAYFYLPTNVPKFHFLFSKLSQSLKELILSMPFIDYGSGPGTFSYALLSHGFKEKIYCVDKSELMLLQAKKILEGVFQANNILFETTIKNFPEDATLCFGHSINEMEVSKTLEIINTLNPKVILIFEPGTSDLFIKLKTIRENLISKYDVQYPCPSNATCPNSWCHQVIRLTHSNSVERLSQLVSLDRKIMPLFSMALVKKDLCLQSRDSFQVTIVRFLNETKFSFIYEACFYMENENRIIKVEFLKRDLTKTEIKIMKEQDIGEIMDVVLDKEVGDTWRVKVKKKALD
jgi:SAM-dependent methyltransferase